MLIFRLSKIDMFMKNLLSPIFAAVTAAVLLMLSTTAAAQTDSPIIGISASSFSGTGANYVKAVRRAGGIPLVIPMTSDPSEIAKILETVDALVMTGGEDIVPARYGERSLPELQEVFPERDDFDIKLIRIAVQKGLPVLGICRGAQVMNVAFGGTLYQDIPSQLPDTFVKHQIGARNEVMHKIAIAEGTILHGILGDEAGVNTSHHQAVKDVAPGFTVSAVSEDGVVEAIEKTGSRCVIGVQFHPEGFVANGNDSFLPLFDYFIRSARD